VFSNVSQLYIVLSALTRHERSHAEVPLDLQHITHTYHDTLIRPLGLYLHFCLLTLIYCYLSI